MVLAGRLMFEAFVHPKVLLRVLSYIVFDGAVDTGGVRFVVAAGEIVQRRAELDLIATAGQAVITLALPMRAIRLVAVMVAAGTPKNGTNAAWAVP